ncbi:MAG: 16S rRNA (guanine(527)-N(7))-methyltransferase RsmG [Pseudomonadota bacterium]|nr:16S rRNA (guanine(527)-N(7))-methyltransferase RsmG [Pseudomonadota bacterium]
MPDTPPLLPPLDVSRETLHRLEMYLDLLKRWNPAINLVSASTLPDAWNRHIVDSAQLFPLLPPGTRHVLDMGSGAGFPGLVLAILGVPRVTLVESDSRKCVFLKETARITGIADRVTVINRRLENLAPQDIPAGPADVVTARALAPLHELLAWAVRFLAQEGTCLFLKGKTAAQEEAEARKTWSFQAERFPGRTDPEGTILRLKECVRAPS